MLKIAVLDSGAGGLTILEEVLKRKLNCTSVYLADLAKHPYGLQPENDLIKRVTLLVEKLVEEEHPDGVVIACNTASTAVLPELRSRWNIPFVGVVPAIKPAIQITKTGSIGVLATPGTVTRPYLNALIESFANSEQVHCYGSDILVAQAENLIRGEKIDETAANSELSRLLDKDSDMDTIVLACTHFPLLKTIFTKSKSAHRSLTFIDSTEAIANRLEQLFPDISSHAATDSASTKHHCTLLSTSKTPLGFYADYLDRKLNGTPLEFTLRHLIME